VTVGGCSVAEDPYTTHMQLCGPDGMVAGEYMELLNRLRQWNSDPDKRKPYNGAPFPCTGSAHLAGQHIRCTSSAHTELARARGGLQ
jgi:hypothetical protein